MGRRRCCNVLITTPDGVIGELLHLAVAAKDQEFCFSVIQYQKIPHHPLAYFINACLQVTPCISYAI